LGDSEIKAEKVKFLVRPKACCALFIGLLALFLLPTFFYVHSLRGFLKHYDRSEYLRIADFDLKVLETKRAIDSLKIKEMDDELAYRYATLIARYASSFELDPLDIVSVIYQESSFNPQAISPTGDYGLMGINWHYVGRHRVKDKRDLLNVETNLRIGVEMLNFWREFSRKSTRKGELIPSLFNHYNQGVFVQNETYSKKVMIIRKRLAVYQILVPNHLLAMERHDAANISP